MAVAAPAILCLASSLHILSVPERLEKLES